MKVSMTTFNESDAQGKLKIAAEKSFTFAKENLNKTMSDLATKYGVTLSGTLEDQFNAINEKITNDSSLNNLSLKKSL